MCLTFGVQYKMMHSLFRYRTMGFSFFIEYDLFSPVSMLFGGVFINPVIPPACAPQDTLVRFALMATHTKEQVDFAIEKLTKCFKQLDILK